MSEVKAEAKVEHITIKVKALAGEEVEFKIKKTTSMGKVLEAYAQKLGINKTTIRFKFDGEEVNAAETPGSLGMDDGDSLDAFIMQLGGRC
ncbi:Small ubiquitin- modifier 1 [Podochytrium sp. JEL0797]|nr:Small ubiquitin- modifier 1 [Podochytrium sp. JEL0797]